MFLKTSSIISTSTQDYAGLNLIKTLITVNYIHIYYKIGSAIIVIIKH